MAARPYELKLDIEDRQRNILRLFVLPVGYSYEVQVEIEESEDGFVNVATLLPGDIEKLLNVCLSILTDNG